MSSASVIPVPSPPSPMPMNGQPGALVHGDAPMPHEAQVEIIERVLTHLRDETTDTSPTTHCQPVATYHSPEHHRREIDRVFRRQPRLACHVSRIAAPGSYITVDHAGVPLVVARDGEGRLKAFLNVCRHRGARVVSASAGKAKCFVCPYHAWTYDTAGCLRHVPHEDGFPDLDASERALVPVAAVERHGCIWISLDRSSPLDVDAHLGPMAPQIAGLALDRHCVHEQYEQVTAMNWKLVIDGFLEAYHIRSTHRDTFYGAVFDNLALHDHYQRHSRTIYPLRKIRALHGRAPEKWRLRPVASLIYHVFPSTILAVEPYHVSLFDISPIDVGHTRIHATVLVTPEDLLRREKVIEDVALLKAGLAEDYAIGESIQAGFATGANEYFHFGLFEGTLAHFHRSVAEVLGDG